MKLFAATCLIYISSLCVAQHSQLTTQAICGSIETPIITSKVNKTNSLKIHNQLEGYLLERNNITPRGEIIPCQLVVRGRNTYTF
jgi:hypothetical protein